VSRRVTHAPEEQPAAVALQPAAQAPSAVLRTAAHAVGAAWEDDSADPAGRFEALRVLDWLVAATEQAIRGDGPKHGGLAAVPLGRRVLESLRSEVLHAWRAVSPPPEPADVLALFEALERVREALELDDTEDFRSRLSGADGLDLVVEVAHDLRSPLTSILFLADTLGRGQSGGLNELQQRQLRLIYSAALGLNSLASDVIELARGGDRLVETEPEPFSIAEVLESLHRMVRPIAEEKGLEIHYTIPTSERREGRPMALSRVLLNLTTNALKFTDEGFVAIAGKAKGLTGVEFSVRDTGHGITKDALSTLFNPFQHSRARRGHTGYHFSGTGLGLAMCRKLVTAMGSELKCESRPDWGTRFYFEVDLPITRRL
jgi:signal transduction histidine kinase